MQQSVQQQRCRAGKGVCTVVLFSVAELAKRQNCISHVLVPESDHHSLWLSGSREEGGCEWKEWNRSSFQLLHRFWVGFGIFASDAFGENNCSVTWYYIK